MSMVEALSQADILACGMIVAAIITLPVLIYGPTAPYGRYVVVGSIVRACCSKLNYCGLSCACRYSTTGWGVLIPNKIAWFVRD